MQNCRCLYVRQWNSLLISHLLYSPIYSGWLEHHPTRHKTIIGSLHYLSQYTDTDMLYVHLCASVWLKMYDLGYRMNRNPSTSNLSTINLILHPKSQMMSQHLGAILRDYKLLKTKTLPPMAEKGSPKRLPNVYQMSKVWRIPLSRLLLTKKQRECGDKGGKQEGSIRTMWNISTSCHGLCKCI